MIWCSNMCVQSMDEAPAPWFPAWGIKFNEVITDPRLTAAMLLQNRKDERWLLLGNPTVVSERNLWAAWLALRERVISDKMVSKSLDGEFMRLIAGTHQMSVAFNRSGIQTGDQQAWLIRIPEWSDFDIDEMELPSYNGENDDDAYELMNWIEAEILPIRPSPSLGSLDRLGINYDQNNEDINIEKLVLTHTAIVDVD
ncbi:MAG: hypothetical protein CMO20_03715 [Thermoplasmata archaeon]|nr:hypothetical protein [Thermoplasmata archaeon]